MDEMVEIRAIRLLERLDHAVHDVKACGVLRRSARRTHAIAALAFAAIALGACSAGAGHHPMPRSDVTGARVLPASTFGEDTRLVRAYTAAREMPEVFDGLDCYCQCHANFGHRSLLTCYESEHAAACDICLTEGTMAAQMHRQGSSLDDIRRAIDAQFRT